MRTPDKTIQRKGKGQRRKKQCQKRLSKRPATHLQSSCLSEFLTYCVTAVVNVQSIARMALKTSHSDAQTQVRMCLGSRCRGNGTECRKGHTDRTFLRFHFHKKKRTTHRPAFDQNVWNFTLKPDLGCGHLCFNRVYFFFSKAK